MKHPLIQAFEKQQLRQEMMTEFSPGDTVSVHVQITQTVPDTASGNKNKPAKGKIKHGSRRAQVFTGVVIAKRRRGLHSAFTVRKISHGIGVERVFPLHSPLVEKIECLRRGDVRQAKLFYLRGLSAKQARIPEKFSKNKSI